MLPLNQLHVYSICTLKRIISPWFRPTTHTPTMSVQKLFAGDQQNLLIVVGYTACLFCNALSAILVTSTKHSSDQHTYSYNPLVVVFYQIVIKLALAAFIYVYQHSSVKALIAEITTSTRVWLLYFVPAFLYFLSDCLWYFNLANFDPVTYNILWQFRIVATGIIYQILFRRLLSRIQWLSLFLLTFGCLIKQLKTPPSSSSGSIFPYFLVLVQIVASCAAGVYNEYLLKDIKVHLMVQNIFMYVNSLICSIPLLASTGSGQSVTSQLIIFLTDILPSEPKLIFVMLNLSVLGIMTSLFLKNLNSIFRTFGSALEMIFTTFLTWVILSIPIDAVTALSISILICSMFVYAKNPVVNKPLRHEVHESSINNIKFGSDGTPLLKEENNV